MKRKAAILTVVAGAVAVAFTAFMIGTLGGCGGGSIAAIGAASQQSNPDNPLYPMPPSHPQRIAFLSDRPPENVTVIWAMNSNGTLPAVVAKTKTKDDTPIPYTGDENKNRFVFLDPAISRDGFTVYYASDYYTPTTNIVKTGITNTAQVNVVQQDVNLGEPKVSWDGKTVAFVGYTKRQVTAIIKPEKQPLSSSGVPLTESQSLMWLAAGGWKLTTRLDADNTDFGLLMIDKTGLTQCPAPNSLADNNAPQGPTNPKYVYEKKIEFTPIMGRYNFTKETYPLGKTICLNMDNTNFLIMEVTEYEYGFTKEPNYVCTTTQDSHCQKAVFSTSDFICTRQGICQTETGAYTTKICSTSADCGDGTCDTEFRCLAETGKSAYIRMKWTWVEQTISGTEVTDVNVVVDDADPISISDSIDDSGVRTGSGVNLIQTFDFKSYDLYTANLDGTNIVKHTSDDIAERYPCFSPSYPDVVYYARAVASEAYQDVDDPATSEIYRLFLGTGQSEKVFTAPDLVRHCSFNSSGSMMAFSMHNGTNFDIYLYDLTTGTIALVADTGGEDLWPSFSPAGNLIAFQSDVSGDNDIYTTNLTGSVVKNLTNNRDYEDTSPAWSP